MYDKKELNMAIGERVKRAREKADYTQERFAEAIDVSSQYISDLERGKVGASVQTIIKICDTLKVSADYILLGREAPEHEDGITGQLQYLSADERTLMEAGFQLMLKAFHSGNSD